MNKIYLKILLNNVNNSKNEKRIKKYIIKKNNPFISYLKIEIKKIIKEPNIFSQNIFQYFIIVIIITLLLANIIEGNKQEFLGQNIINEMGEERFKLQETLLVVGIIQIFFCFSSLPIIAISKEGKNAEFIKYIPMSLYKQLKIKIIPPVLINFIVCIVFLSTLKIKVQEISTIYFLMIFIISMIINIINIHFSILIDLKKPILNWVSIDAVTKNNERNLYKYIITIFILIILKYFSEIFKEIKYSIAITSIILALLFIYIILNIYIKKNINKIFKNIY